MRSLLTFITIILGTKNCNSGDPTTIVFYNDTVSPVVTSPSPTENGNRPAVLLITVSRYHLHLKLNELIMAQGFTTTYYDQNGNEVTTTGSDNCYYQGWVEPFQYQNVSFYNWNVTLSTCHGLRGRFGQSSDGYIHIEPLVGLNDTLEQPHILYHTFDNNYQFDLEHCGYLFVPASNTSGSRLVHSQFNESYAVELPMYIDHTEYLFHGGDVGAVIFNTISLINAVDMLFDSLNVNVALVHIGIWSNGDMIFYPNDNDISTVHQNFGIYLFITGRYEFDVANLLSGRSFSNNVVGVAYLSGACRGWRFGTTVVSGGSRPSSYTAVIMAHEIGHALGMFHDDESCLCADPTGTCIMEAAISFRQPPSMQWSNCSRSAFMNNIELLSCIYNTPTAVINFPLCGNGIIEIGEQCECNVSENCFIHDPCCNYSSCRFHLPSRVCRPDSQDCDIRDRCSGSSSACQCNCYPGYDLLMDGITCTDINECMLNTSGCSQGCVNNAGSFECTCFDGFILDQSGGRACHLMTTSSTTTDNTRSGTVTTRSGTVTTRSGGTVDTRSGSEVNRCQCSRVMGVIILCFAVIL